MRYIIGRISDHKIVENVDIGNNINVDAYMEAVSINHGGSPADYFPFTLNSDSVDAKRVQSGDEYVVVWDNNIITGVDFSIEDNRKLFMIKTVDPDDKNVVKDTIVGDNIDSVIIQTRVCSADGTLDTSVNATALIPVHVPDNRTIYLKVVIENGIGAELRFKTLIEGIWTVVPTKIMVGDEKMRIQGDNGIGASNTINVLMNI